MAFEQAPLKRAVFYADQVADDADQAAAFFLPFSPRLSKTTEQVITVDGGLHKAFLR